MQTMSSQPSFQRKFSALAAHTSGAIAVGAGLAVPFGALAEPVMGDGLTVKPINLTINNTGLDVDLHGDGTFDFSLLANSNYATVKSGSIGSLDFLSGGKYLERLAAGSTVSAASNGSWTYLGAFYIGDQGPWGAIGDHGYLGLRFTDGGGQHNYGWLEVTRGSITLGQFGYQSAAGVAAVIPSAAPPATAVPEPSSLLLLASGAAGLLAMRRRRQQQAGAQPAAH